ncbi:hypothetical protein H4S07_001367 [Coemansia furcata]|uniref:Uncharacterized protein n=1 Tax=Coemansia furcata TaxID=417177 RepID=A0ACC1LNW2_9FUNG|nr:hypothetical protein H4S07_001367 [Coemansia furcata]
MSTHLSPAAQFAAAAEAEARALLLAESVSAAVTISEDDVAPADEDVPVPFLAICPAAPPGYVAPEFPPVSEAMEEEVEGHPKATICVCPPAPPAYVRPGFPGDAVSDDVVDATASDENVARQVSAAAMFENAAAVDSAVGSDDDGSSDAAVASVEVRRSKVVDLNDQELFPALGGSTAKAPIAWGSKALPRATGALQQGKQQQRATEVVDLLMMQEAVGAAVLKIMERTGARIDVSHNAVLATSTYVISGAVDAVGRAKREVVAKLSPRVTQVVAVPAEARAAVVGVRGRGLQAIQAKTGAVLAVGAESFDAGDSFATVDVSVSGDALGVAAAVAMVEAAADKRTTRRVAFEAVARDAHALLVGKGGAGLRALQDAHSGVTLRIPGPLDAGAVGVAGERPAVQAACAHIREMSNALMGASQVVSVAVAKRQHRFVVGERGSGLRDIALATGCSVSVPPPRAASEQISVRGAPADVGQAVQMVLERAASLAVDTFDPAQAAGAYGRPLLYAQRALRYFHDRARLRRIESEHGAVLRVAAPAAVAAATDPAQLVIEITAPTPAAVAGARAGLAALFAAFPPHHFNGMDVEPHQAAALAESVGRLQAQRSVYALLAPEGGVLVVYEGFNPDVDRIADAAERERKTRDLLRLTLEEFRATLAAADPPVALVAQVPVAQQPAMAAAQEPLLRAAGAAEGASRVVLRFGSVATAQAEPLNSRVTPRKDDALAPESVEVRGPADAAARVVAEIERRVAQAAAALALRSFRADVAVPQGLVARVVGRGGETLKKLRAGRDVNIDVADASVRITGTRSDVDAVSAEISALVERLADECAETIVVAAELHRALIGSGGKFVRRLGDKYHVRIQFPKADSAEEAEPLGADQIRIRGGRAGVESAKAELLELAAYEIEHGHTVKFSVPADCLPHVVGRAGSRISEIKDASDTRIDLGESTGGQAVDVTIVGTRAGVAQARAAIEAVVAEQQAQADDVVVVAHCHHRFLIGAAGARVRELVTQAGGDPDAATGAGSCRVQFPRAGSADADSVRLKGDRVVVAAVRARIEELVAERERQVTVAVNIPATQHAFVIGRGGAHLKQLQDAHSVEINFPRRGGSDADVRITGLPDNCAAASAALLALVRDEAKVVVALAQHQRLGGRTSALWRRVRADFGVQVDAAHVDRAPPKPAFDENAADDVVFLPLALDGLTAEWILRGEASKLPAALEAVNKALAESVESVDARVRVDPRSHRHIIGKQGAMIAKIRDATTCDVAVPARGSESPWVSVTGPRNEVERAIDMINDAIEERA